MRNTLFCLLVVLFVASASAQAPMTAGAKALMKHRVKMVPPSYPLKAKEAYVSGTVVLRIVISPEGDVTQAKPVSGPALLRSAAESCVKQWKYRPFKQDGKAVVATGNVNLIFTLSQKFPRTPVEKFKARMLPQYAREPALVERGFSCQIDPEWSEMPAVQSLPANSPVRAWLERTKLRMVEKAGGTPSVTANAPAKPELNATELASARQVVRKARQSLLAFSLSWLPFGVEAVMVMPDAELRKSGDRTEIEFGVQGTINRLTFDKNLLLIHFLQQYSNGMTVNQTPHFEETSGGLLYTGTDVVVGKLGGKEHLAYAVDYQNVGQFHLPKTVVETGSGGAVSVHFRFRDCKVNPPASPIHLNSHTVILHVKPK